jgi:glutathione S-transferase
VSILKVILGMELTVAVALERFRNEVLRVFGVLEIQLSGKYTGEPREYLAGNGKGKYSIADIGTWRK